MARLPTPVVSGSNDNWGGYSIERYADNVGSLQYCHDDAQNFLARLATKASPANFWSKDTAVQAWAFEEPEDNKNDTLGMDAVAVLYYCGHGLMDGNGRFSIPLGSTYNGKTWAYSTDMAFGNEKLRYLFWSTCNSINLTNGNSPLKTWWDPNKGGLRMMFGYAGLTWDWASYGKYFWLNVDKGKSFARAFMDASIYMGANQVPVVVASAATQAEALAMLANERTFIKTPSIKGWYEWQYQGNLQGAITPRLLTSKQPAELIHTNKFDKVKLNKLRKRIRDDFSKTQDLSYTEGKLEMFLGNSNHENRKQIFTSKAVEIAKDVISTLELDQGIELIHSGISPRFTCGGTLNGSGSLDNPSVIETIVQFRQTHDGIPSINSSHGLISIHIDNDGKVCNIHDSTKPIVDAIKKPEIEEFLISNEAGYDFSGEKSVLVSHEDIVVDYGKGLKKLKRIRTNI
jgi:hypothetical protein